MTDALTDAMANVTEQERLRREDAVGGAGAVFITDRPAPPRRPSATLIETLDRALQDAEAHSDAVWAVMRCVKRARRDLAEPTLEDSEAIRDIYARLRNVQGTAA